MAILATTHANPSHSGKNKLLSASVDLEQSAEEHGPFGLRLQPAKAVKKYRLVDAYFD